MIEFVNPRLDGNLIRGKDGYAIEIPAGCIGTKKALEKYILQYSNESNTLKATSKDGSEVVELLPLYSATEIIDIKGKKIELLIREVVGDVDQYIANSIIESTHYLKPPYKGLMIVAEFKNVEDKLDILKTLKKEPDDSFQKVLSGFSNVIGCAIIDQMTYANPKGRIDVINMIGCADQIVGKQRDEIQDLLKIAWISRFAVLGYCQDFGIGTILAKHAAIVAGCKRIPKANYVEVFTTHTKMLAKEILESENKGFLKKAGYKVFNELLDSKPVYDTKEQVLKTYRKLYYYKRIEE